MRVFHPTFNFVGMQIRQFISGLGQIFLLCMPAVLVGQSSNAEGLRKSIDKIIRFDTTIDFDRTPGFLVGVIDGDQTYTLAFGTRDQSSTDTIATTDRFEIGALTKVFSSTLMALLEENGVIDIDQFVNSCIPGQYRNARLEQLKIASLLSHTSGLPKFPPMFGDRQLSANDPYATFTNEDLLTSYRDLDEIKPRFIYSHVNYALIETILEECTRQSYRQLLEEYVFQPLKLTATGLDLDTTIAPGHYISGYPSKPWTFTSFKSSEGLKSNMQDLLKFMQFSLHDAPDRLWVKDGKVNKRLSMSLGWYVIEQRRTPLIHAHTGHTDGHYAFAAMVRSTETAVVILANSSTGVEDLGILILRLINHNWKRKVNGKKVQKP